MITKKNNWQKVLDIFELIISSYKARKGDPEAWESTIKRFEEQDQLHLPPKDSILFIGSSSINFWSTLTQDMSPLSIINRGFGGSYMRDMVNLVLSSYLLALTTLQIIILTLPIRLLRIIKLSFNVFKQLYQK